MLDLFGYIEDLNPAANRKLVLAGIEPVGKQVAQVAPVLAPLIAQAALVKKQRFEMALGEVPDAQYFDVRISPISGSASPPVGRLLVCHEITTLTRWDGSRFLAEVSLGLLQSPDGVRIAWNIHDITERQKADLERGRKSPRNPRIIVMA